MIVIPLLNELLRRLRGYFQIGVAEGEIDDPTPTADPDIDDPVPTADPDTEDPAPAVSAADRRAQEAETKARQLQEELDRERSARAIAARHPAPQPDALFEQEEARLRDPQISDLERWQIGANRQLRQSAAAAQQAQISAADTSDRAAYQTAAIDNPRMRKYADRVERELAGLRAKGQNASRQAIYLFLLGQDVDKAQSAPAAKKATTARPNLPDAARGRPAGVRSDVSARGSQTEREKRRERLANVLI